jgi:hypothetical protein
MIVAVISIGVSRTISIQVITDVTWKLIDPLAYGARLNQLSDGFAHTKMSHDHNVIHTSVPVNILDHKLVYITVQFATCHAMIASGLHTIVIVTSLPTKPKLFSYVCCVGAK